MAKGRLVTPGIEELIARTYKDHAKWTAKEVQRDVNKRLRQVDPSIKPGWPGISTVQKVLATVRKTQKERQKEPHPQDKQWHLATQDTDYAIPNAAIPSVLKVWARRYDKGIGFTVREAKWASRLWAVIADVAELSRMSSVYAAADQIYEFIGHPFVSTSFDCEVMGIHTQGEKLAEAGVLLGPPGKVIGHAAITIEEGKRGMGPLMIIEDKKAKKEGKK